MNNSKGGRNAKVAFLLMTLVLTGCTSPRPVDWFIIEESQIQQRSKQARIFRDISREAMLALVVATLLDLGFMIEHSDDRLGVVAGSKNVEADAVDVFSWKDGEYRTHVQLTVNVEDIEPKAVSVRAVARQDGSLVEDQEIYQRFHTLLQHSIFIKKENALSRSF